MLSFFGIGQHSEIKINLHNDENRKKEECRSDDGKVYHSPIFYDGETISGTVIIGIKRGGKLEHQGIKIEFVSQIELCSDRGNREDVIRLTQDLARPGILSHSTTYPFEFLHVEKPYDSYRGTNVQLRYFLRVVVQKRLADINKEFELIVQSIHKLPECDNNIQMEVGIEDSLHIEFEYNKSKYHLRDVIVGNIYFLLVRVKIKNMEIQILKRETIGSGPTTFNETETIAKYEIMDGAPGRGESIPIRLFLCVYNLCPTMRDVYRKFSVRYFLNLVLLDEEDRRYYKQQEIILYRKMDRCRKKLIAQSMPPSEVGAVENGQTEVDTPVSPTNSRSSEQVQNDNSSVSNQEELQSSNSHIDELSTDLDPSQPIKKTTEAAKSASTSNLTDVLADPTDANTDVVEQNGHSQSDHLAAATRTVSHDDDDVSDSEESYYKSRSARSMHRYQPIQAHRPHAADDEGDVLASPADNEHSNV